MFMDPADGRHYVRTLESSVLSTLAWKAYWNVEQVCLLVAAALEPSDFLVPALDGS